MKKRKFLAYLLAMALLVSCMAPCFVSAEETTDEVTYNTTVAANTGTIVTEGAAWGTADLYPDVSSSAQWRLTPGDSSVSVVYSGLFATRFVMRGAKLKDCNDLIFEAWFKDSDEYETITVTPTYGDTYSRDGMGTCLTVEYTYDAGDRIIRDLRVTRGSTYNANGYRFSLVDILYEREVDSYFDYTVAANTGTIVTEGAAWDKSDLYPDVSSSAQWRLTPGNSSVSVVYSGLFATRFVMRGARLKDCNDLTFEALFKDSDEYEKITVTSTYGDTYSHSVGKSFTVEYSYDAGGRIIRDLRVTRGSTWETNGYRFSLVDILYEREADSYFDYTVAANTGVIANEGISWVEAGHGYYDSTLSYCFDDSDAVIEFSYSGLNATEFMVCTAELAGLSKPVLSFEVSYDGENFETVTMSIYKLAEEKSGYPRYNYVSPKFEKPVKVIKITRATCYGQAYQRFSMADLRYNAYDLTIDSYTDSDGILYNIADETLLTDFLANITTDFDVTVTAADGTALTDTDFVGTGANVSFKLGDMTYESRTVAICGDTDGDGVMGASDLVVLRKCLLGKDTLEGAYMLAADVKTDNALNILDLVALKKKHLLK